MNKTKRKANWNEKPCDVCGEGTQITTVGHREYDLPTRNHLFEMKMEDGICEYCGFMFVRETPPESFLFDYYNDDYTFRSKYADVEPDYNTEARVKVIGKYLDKSDKIFELGANTGHFIDSLAQNGYNAYGMDPVSDENEQVEENYISGKEDKNVDRFDAVVSNHVLEHSADANGWVKEAKSYLKPGGIMKIEVPDFKNYPYEALAHHHFLHFTPQHLEYLMRKHGFETVEIEESKPSREFGFVYVGRLTNTEINIREAVTANQAEKTKILYNKAKKEMEEEEHRYEETATLVNQTADEIGSEVDIYFWAANEHASAIAKKLDGTISPQIVDSSETKIGTHHLGFDAPILPPEFDKKIDNHRIFVLCSPGWNDEIRDQIKQMELTDITILDATDISN